MYSSSIAFEAWTAEYSAYARSARWMCPSKEACRRRASLWDCLLCWRGEWQWRVSAGVSCQGATQRQHDTHARDSLSATHATWSPPPGALPEVKLELREPSMVLSALVSVSPLLALRGSGEASG
jgi:hypothetical protein